MPDVFANGRSILHKGHGQTHTCAVPDVCKTPSPGGPVPIPYVNMAMDSNLAKGTKKVKINKKMVAHEKANLSTSTGDEPGTAGGGIMSSKTKGKMTWGMYSFDVKFEGKGVTRFMDVTLHNGNTFNSAFTALGGTGFAYGDDEPCTACGEGLDKHRVLETKVAETMASELIIRLNKDFMSQRSKIDKYLKLRKDRKTTDEKLRKNIESEKAKGASRKEIAALKLDRKTQLAAFDTQMKAINTSLESDHVLGWDMKTKTYTKAMMVGAMVCKCGAKKLAACSGSAVTKGFELAASDLGFTTVDAFTPTDTQKANLGGKPWNCAAPKLIKNAGGHKAGTMSEKWFSPYEDTRTVKVTFSRDGKTVTESFSSGQTVPSCDKCQKNVPEMLCHNDEDCP